MIASVEVVVDAIYRYTLIEQLYCGHPHTAAIKQLRESVVKVYTAILEFLCKAKLYFDRNTAGEKRLAYHLRNS